MRSSCPIGSSFGQYFFAIASLMTTTRSPAPVSPSVNTRPRSSGTLNTRKYCGEIERHCSSPLYWPPCVGALPTIANGRSTPASTGSTIVDAAASMPGTPSSRRTTCVVRFADGRGRRIRGGRERGLEREHVPRIEAGFDGAESDEAADQQRGAHEQHDRQRRFDDHERRTDPLVTHTGAGAAAGLLERRDEIGLGGVQRRKQTEHDSRQNRERHREDHDAPVERRNHDPAAIGRRDARNVAGHQQQQTANARCAKGEAEHASRAGQQHALGQQLTDNASATGADRGSDRELALPARRSREQQVGHVAARDQQHQRDRAEQHQQRRSHVARRRLAHRHDGDAFLLVHPLRVQLAKIFAADFHLCPRRVHADARFQTGRP